MTIAVFVLSGVSIVLGAVGAFFAFELWRDRRKVADWNLSLCIAGDLRKRIKNAGTPTWL